MFTPDAPINNAKEDKLGRTPFASALAKAIVSFLGEESFVVGLHGKWGSGKSSILNLVVEQVEKQNASKAKDLRLNILRFNPWNFADQNQLIFQFFRQFRAFLNDDKHGLKELLNSLDEYADALAPPLELLPYGRLVSAGMKSAVKGSQKLLGVSRDINVLFEKISKESRKLKRRTLILIDDIDRLTADETRQIFQLVKLTAKFPYVVYVLAFDRHAVAQALTAVGIESGEEYLEKIVQVSFDIPPISESALTNLILAGIGELLQKEKPASFNQNRFGNLFHGGFRKSFESLRDVIRFLNGLEFGLGLIGQETNGVDFIGMEAIRVFYPKIFYAVRNNKNLFAGHIDTFIESAGSSKYSADLDKVLVATGEFSENVKDLLLELFPKLAFAFGNTVHGHTSETQWEKSYRIATSRYFDAYFSLALPEADVSVREVNAFLLSSDNERQLEEMLTRWHEEGKLKRATESLRFRLSEVPKTNRHNVLSALAAIGDKASTQGSLLAGQVPEFMFVQWAIFDTLDALPPEDQVATVREVFSKSTSLKTMANILILIEQMKAENATKFEIFSQDTLQELKNIVLDRIRSVAKTPALIENESLPMIMAVWRDWGGENSEPQAFVDESVKSDVGLLSFLNNFIYQRYSSSGRTLETKNRLSVKSLSEWMDVNSLLGRLDTLKRIDLSEKNGLVYEIVHSELQRFKNSRFKPEQFDNDPFMD